MEQSREELAAGAPGARLTQDVPPPSPAPAQRLDTGNPADLDVIDTFERTPYASIPGAPELSPLSPPRTPRPRTEWLSTGRGRR